MPLEKNRAAVILLGASAFPRSKNFQPDDAFLNAKTRIYNYFTDQQGLSLEVPARVLDLFNSDKDPNTQDDQICDFIKQVKNQNIQDLFIYYVGHGGFAPSDKSFYLAIQSTRAENPAVSSITLSTLAGSISRFAADLRTFIILDCCFSAGANRSFQFNSSEVVGTQIMESFPDKGIALLCSSSKDVPSLIIRERNITMFTEGLEMALRKGDSCISSKYLSLKQLHNLTYSFIKQLNPGESIRPEVSSPRQPLGDISEIPHFFNYAFKEASADIVAQKRELEGEIIRNNLIGLSNLFIDFVRNFDVQQRFNDKSILICSDCNDLEEDKSSIDRVVYKERRKELYRQIMEIINEVMLQSPTIPSRPPAADTPGSDSDTNSGNRINQKSFSEN